MWPFKRKDKKVEIETPVFMTILCIPGNWRDMESAKLSIFDASDAEYVVAAGVLANHNNDRYYHFEYCQHDERMKKSFGYAGQVNRVSEGFLDDIENHTSVIYISGSTGNFLDAELIAKAGAAILKAGGIGIKVESAGLAFERNQWLSFFSDFKEANLYKMFVIDSISDPEGTFSCGMQNLGLKDTIVSGLDFQDANYLISVFNYYQIIDKPTILNGETFSPLSDSSKYKISEEHDQPYKDDQLFGNPNGMWRLTKL